MTNDTECALGKPGTLFLHKYHIKGINKMNGVLFMIIMMGLSLIAAEMIRIRD